MRIGTHLKDGRERPTNITTDSTCSLFEKFDASLMLSSNYLIHRDYSLYSLYSWFKNRVGNFSYESTWKSPIPSWMTAQPLPSHPLGIPKGDACRSSSAGLLLKGRKNHRDARRGGGTIGGWRWRTFSIGLKNSKTQKPVQVKSDVLSDTFLKINGLIFCSLKYFLYLCIVFRGAHWSTILFNF